VGPDRLRLHKILYPISKGWSAGIRIRPAGEKWVRELFQNQIQVI
jgi:hypothetical protein